MNFQKKKSNMFGNEIGSLSENLVLNTAGKVKIRFGQKYIDLLNDKGQLNVTIPKIIKSIKSKSEMKTNGFYYLDDNLFAHIDGVTLPILKEPILSIYNSNLEEPSEEEISLVYLNGTWQYIPIVLQEQFIKLSDEVKTLQEKIEELESKLNEE